MVVVFLRFGVELRWNYGFWT